jgi:hypothetical protein
VLLLGFGAAEGRGAMTGCHTHLFLSCTSYHTLVKTEWQEGRVSPPLLMLVI